MLIHERLLESLNTILQNRSDKLKNNKYVFAKESEDTSIDHYYESYQIIRPYSIKCGVQESDTLRGTLLRKQLATMMYAIDLQDADLKDLANFLGHEMDIHKNYYRQNIPIDKRELINQRDQRELINLTPLLEQAQGSTNIVSRRDKEDTDMVDETCNESMDQNTSVGSEYVADAEDNEGNDETYKIVSTLCVGVPYVFQTEAPLCGGLVRTCFMDLTRSDANNVI